MKFLLFIVTSLLISINGYGQLSERDQGLFTPKPKAEGPINDKLNALKNGDFVSEGDYQFEDMITLEKLEGIREVDAVKYNYLMEFKAFYDSLDQMIKRVFTPDEILYIYAFDPEGYEYINNY